MYHTISYRAIPYGTISILAHTILTILHNDERKLEIETLLANHCSLDKEYSKNVECGEQRRRNPHDNMYDT